MGVCKQAIAPLLIALLIHPSVARAVEPEAQAVDSEAHDVNIEWRTTPPEVMIWYGAPSASPPPKGGLSLLGRDADAAFLSPGTYQFWASMSELDEPKALAKPVLITEHELTTISVELIDYRGVRTWGGYTLIAGVLVCAIGTTTYVASEDKGIPTGLVIGGGAGIGLGVLIVAIGMWMSEGFKPHISSRPLQGRQ